jgi:hypothetical protein
MGIGLEVNAEKSKYMMMSCHQNVGLKITYRSFENVSQFKY